MKGNGVSIAILSWNREMLLPRSVASALAAVRLLRERQVPAEVLVIDDGSRDGSPTLLRQLEALHFGDGLRVLIRSTSAGPANARNLGLVRARQRHIVFMEAGSELVPDTLPLFRCALMETGAAAAYGNVLVRPRAAHPARSVVGNESFQGRMFRHNYVAVISMVDRLQILDGGGYSDSLAPREDSEQWLHLACNGREVLFVPLVIGYHHPVRGPKRRGAADQNRNPKKLYDRRQQIFDPTGARHQIPTLTMHRRYHPSLGYI